MGAREIESFAERQDSELFAFRPDDPDFAGTDFPIDP